MNQYLTLDCLKEVALFFSPSGAILHACPISGITHLVVPHECSHYTYKKHVIPFGHCLQCGRPLDHWQSRCVSASGNHSFVGEEIQLSDIPRPHQARSYALHWRELHFEELRYAVELEHCFPIEVPL
jgi:hypothetical protein